MNKRILSIILSVAMLISLFSITATAATINNISVEFDPRVGESIISNPETILNQNISTNCYIERKFAGDAVTAFTAAEIDSLEDIEDFYSEHTPLSVSEYEEQEYLFIFSLWLNGDEANTPTIKSADNALTGHPLFVDDNTLYFYFTFTPQAPESNDNTNTNIDNSNSGTNSGSSNTLISKGTQNIDVNATYKSSGEEMTVYSVVIEWGSMEFTYNSEFAGTWNPGTHKYDGHVDAYWTCETDANAITVTNHSNAEITANFEYESLDGYNSVEGSFSSDSEGEMELKAPYNLDSAAKANDATSFTAYLWLGGSLLETTADSVTCGTVTVTIS